MPLRTEKKANHSFHATGATTEIITGHKSNALKLCERPSVVQKEAVSDILVQGKRPFAEEVDKENASGSCSIA